MTQTVLILGARGRFGLVAARAFALAGWRVLAQMRPGATAPGAASGIHWLELELGNTKALAAAAAGCSVVVHAISPPYTHRAWTTQALPLLDASISVAAALQATLMLPGNVYNFGTAMPEVLREDTPQCAQTVKGRVRMAMEQRLAQSAVRAVVIRAGDFFGSGRGNWFDLVLTKALARGVLTYPGPLQLGHAWAYLPDLARTFVAVAAKRAELNRFEVFHFAGHQLTGQQWLQALQPLAAVRGWLGPGGTLKVQQLPWSLIRLGALLLPTWAALAEMRYLWHTAHRLDNARLVALLGVEPHTVLAHALPLALDDLGR